MQKALIRANPKLSRFDPLGRIIYFDDFDEGLQGWTSLIGNYEDNLDRMHPGYRQLTTPMLSNLSFWDNGTHGSVDGSYALKMATRPKAGAQNVAIKRLTYVRACPIQIEFWFTFKPEASAQKLLDTDLRSVGILLDLQNDDYRIMPHLRYLNAFEGQRVEKWQFKEKTVPFERFSEKTVTHYHLAERDWQDLSGERQVLCYNEIPTKVNWQYAKLGFDLRTMRYTHFECNDVAYDMSGIGALQIDAMPNLRGMLNVGFFVESDADRRSSFYVDSILVSGEWD
ncbi:MAG: hypothetical protein H6852_14820 [Geminicoccaceae bacterium]|jgi:hypothetical protein|nr:hypothetical protein [Geminicoccaceae bacterium]MCB9968891.1 hypothetical protein [Geminicoccaceae bacterium]HRY27058.1 hypothetical protein [Geminicoccaceae bacterium]